MRAVHAAYSHIIYLTVDDLIAVLGFRFLMAEMRYQHNAGIAFSAYIFCSLVYQAFKLLSSIEWHRQDMPTLPQLANSAVNPLICTLLQQFDGVFPNFSSASPTELSCLRRRKTTSENFFPYGKHRFFPVVKIASHQLPDAN